MTGKVTSASGVKLPSDLEITLHGFDNMQVAITQTTTLQPDGSFTFVGVPMPSGRVFLATINYQNASYGSDIGAVQELLDADARPLQQVGDPPARDADLARQVEHAVEPGHVDAERAGAGGRGRPRRCFPSG